MPGKARVVCAVYALIGDSPFLRSEALGRLFRELGPQCDTLGPARFDGEKAEAAEVLDEVRTPSLLGPRRVVVVEDADAFIKRHREALERYCSEPSDTGILVLLCDSLPRNTRLYKIIAERGGAITCEPPRGLSAWITARAGEVYGKRLPREVAERLRELVGDDLGTLDTELGKLAAYVGDRPTVTREDLAELTGSLREEKVFAVTDAIADRNAAAALARWWQVLATDPAAPHRAAAGLAFAVRRLLEARRDWEAGASVYELARRLYSDPASLGPRLERSNAADLEAMQGDLLRLDLEVKTGLSTTERAVEKLIVQYAAAAGDRPSALTVGARQ